MHRKEIVDFDRRLYQIELDPDGIALLKAMWGRVIVFLHRAALICFSIG